jgi:hypothetical protein
VKWGSVSLQEFFPELNKPIRGGLGTQVIRAAIVFVDLLHDRLHAPFTQAIIYMRLLLLHNVVFLN